MKRNQRRGLPARRRHGFTLIELLVVVTIIAAIIALTASAVMRFLSSQQVANTRAALDRTQSPLNRAWSKVKDQAQKETIPSGVYTSIMTTLAGDDANAVGRARVIYVKLKLRQAFPMNFAEAWNLPYYNPYLGANVPASPLPPLPGYTTYLTSIGVTSTVVGSSSYVPQPYESSACLLMALSRGVSGAGVDDSSLTAGGSAGSVAPYGFPITYLNDSWGQPLLFTRAASGSLALNPSGGATTGNNDPVDPVGYLNSGSWAFGSSTSSPNTTCRTTFFLLTQQQPASATGLSFRLAPMLLSAGADKTLTVNPIWFGGTPPGNTGDDLFSTP
jgi:prepilin-type N-terminal cleavage/methylation domain-containing protein